MGPKQTRHPISLRRRLILQIGSMIIGLILLSAGAVVGINALHHDYGIALRGYQQLREVYEIGQNAASARSALAGDAPDPATARAALRTAMLRLNASRELSETAALRDSLADALNTMSAESMDAVLGRVAEMSAEIRRTVTASQDAAQRKRRITLAAVIGLSVLVVLGGILIGVQQYRVVMNPLRRLGDAVREVATGRFSSQIDESGDREFFELARDFNRMSAELGALYRDLEQKVRDKSKELVRSERLASVGYLAAGVAHEINNPLSIITGYGERALRQLDAEGASSESSSTRKTIEVMCEEAFRCKQITDRLLSLARGGNESLGPVDLATVAEEVISNLTALPEYRDRRIVLEADHRSRLTVHGRDGEIKQVILNLLINAFQSSSNDSVAAAVSAASSRMGAAETAAATDDEATVRLSIDRVADQIELAVIDTGRGMDPKTLDRVFEPFFTSKRGATRGTGLGLSISHAIIADHGGTIQAYSEGMGQGSRFVVRLPAIQGVEDVHA